MDLFRIGTAMAFALVAVPLSAEAQDRLVRRDAVGAWAVEESARAGEANLCSMSSSTPDGRSFNVSFLGGSNQLTVVVASRGWRIPPNTAVPIRYWIDNQSPWNATARPSRDGQAIFFTIGQETMGAWERQWRLGSAMTIAFPQGSEQPWRFTLTGTNAATDLFVACMRRANLTNPRSTPPTKPQGAPTQPHAAPTQPFTPPVRPNSGPPPSAAPPSKSSDNPAAPAPGAPPAPAPSRGQEFRT